jgi:hypothetical protein
MFFSGYEFENESKEEVHYKKLGCKIPLNCDDMKFNNLKMIYK